MRHDKIEKNINLMMVLIVVAISIGGLIEIIPLMLSSDATEPYEGIEPYPALQLAGRDVYVREGCYVCHSQQIRPFRSETERYGPYSVAGEHVYDRPFQFGSKRTGPDLARVGQRYSDEWHRIHMINPRDVVPESNMPGYPWLAEALVDGDLITEKMRALQILGDPYTDEQIAAAAADVGGRSEQDAQVAYQQNQGQARSARGGVQMDIGLVRGLITATILVLFVGIWAWSFSRKRRSDFEAASQLPLGDDTAPPAKSTEEHPS